MYLEDVEALVVDHLPVVPQQLHDDLEVFAGVHVLCHYIIICPVEQNLAQELDRLAFCDITLGLDQPVVVLLEELIEVRLQVRRD